MMYTPSEQHSQNQKEQASKETSWIAWNSQLWYLYSDHQEKMLIQVTHSLVSVHRRYLNG